MALAFKEHNLSVSQHSFFALLYYGFVTIDRLKNGHCICFNRDFRDEAEKSISGNVALAAQRIARDIFLWADCDYCEDEVVGFMVQISGKGVFDYTFSDAGGGTVSKRIESLARKMLDAVYEVHGLDLRNDTEMYLSLSQHLVPFDMRMRYDFPLSNPILQNVKKDYAVPYHMAVSACAALQSEYNKPIPDVEIGYFAILFALALQRRNKPAQKNVLVVNISGQASSRLFMHRFQMAFGPYVNHIYTCSAFQVSGFDFETMEIDYVFTNIPLHIKLPVPVFEVSLLLNDQEIAAYRCLLQGEGEDFILQYFKEKLFCGSLSLETKEEVLCTMCRIAGEHLLLPPDFYDSVLEREQMWQTDFGNLVAIPHPCRIMGTEKFASVAVLDKPIWWGHYNVQVVLLISMEQDDPGVERFYQVVSEFMSSPEAVETLIRTPTYQTLLDVLNHKCLK